MAMNVFRLNGDLLHMIAIWMIVNRVIVKKNAQGISRKTQDLLLLVYLCRYMDLLTWFYGWYNTLAKIFFISATGLMCWAMRYWSPTCTTYRADHDSLSRARIVVVCAALTILYMIPLGTSDMVVILWVFSIFLEAAALLPQVVVYRRYRQVENLTGVVFLLLHGAYRGLYILNWVVRANTERGYSHHLHVYVAALAQVLICFLGVFYPASAGESSEEAAPLLPQLREHCKEAYLAWGFVGCVSVLLAGVNDNVVALSSFCAMSSYGIFSSVVGATTSSSSSLPETVSEEEEEASSLRVEICATVGNEQSDNLDTPLLVV